MEKGMNEWKAELRSDLASQPCAFYSEHSLSEPELPLHWVEEAWGMKYQSGVLGFGEVQMVIRRRGNRKRNPPNLAEK